MMKRGLALLLSIVLAISALPLSAFAAEITVPEAGSAAAETAEDTTLLDTSEDNYGNYEFTAFEDLQTLAAGSYTRTTYARYTGEGVLTVSADLALPKNLRLECAALEIAEGATLSTADSAAITAGSLQIDGKLSSRGYLLVEEELTVNGTLEYYTDVYLGADAKFHRNGTLRSMNTGADLIREYELFSLEELKNACAAAAQETGILSVINLNTYESGDLVLEENLSVPANAELTVFGTGSLTIAQGAALELNCAHAKLCVNTTVSGELVINGETSLEEAVLTFTETGVFSGTGVLNVQLSGTAALEDMVAGLDMDTVLATEYNTGGQHYWALQSLVGLTQLGTPAELTWNKIWNPETGALEDKVGTVSWKTAEPWLGSVVVRLFREGETVPVDTLYYESADLTAGQWHSLDLFAGADPESGDYYFTVQAQTDAEGYCSSEAAVSEIYTYTKAAAALGECTALTWNWPTAQWTAPEGSAACEVEFLYAPSSGAAPEGIGTETVTGGSLRISNETLKRSGTGYYYFRVRALSADLTQSAHGPWSQLSEAYVLEALTQSAEEELTYIAENLTDPDEIRQAVQAIDTDALTDAITAEGSTLIDTLAAIEQTAGGPAAVRVEETVTAIDGDKVSVIGANLHDPAADADGPVTLVIGEGQREAVLDSDLDSDAAIAISMTLDNAQVEDTLAVPVQITLPVPETLNPEYLVVLHYLYDGSVEYPELTVFQKDDQWYVSFVVTSLGDFVLTQYRELVASRGTTGSVSWQLSSWGNLTISGTGAMADYESAKGTPWAIHSADIRTVTVEEGVTGVGSWAFSGCENLQTVTLPASVQTIGEAAFAGSPLTAFQVAEGNTAFTALDGVIYNADLTGLVAYPAGKADAVFTLPETVTEIGAFAVYNSRNLREMHLPEGLTALRQWAFGDSVALETINLPASVAVIEDYVFEECLALKEVYFKGNAPAIAETAFACVTADAWYFGAAEGWNEETLVNYGGELTWKRVRITADSELLLSAEYVALEPGETVPLTAEVVPADLMELIQWSSEDEEVVSVDENGLVTANAVGTGYILVTVADGQEELIARCRVDVAEPIEVKDVQLGTTKLTSELFSTDYAQFDLLLVLPQNDVTAMSADKLPDSNRVAIDSVRFTNSTVQVAFDLVALDDRRIAVVPTEYAVEYPDELAKSYKSTVTVTVDGQEYTTAEALTVTVKKSTPKLKASIPAFNSFYTGQTQAIAVTGGTVSGISWNTDKTQPEWLTLNDDGTLSLNEAAPRKSASGKAYLLVDTQEWRIPAAVTLSVKNTYKTPGLKLSASTATVTEEAAASAGITLQLMPKSRKDTLSSLNVAGITAPEGFTVSNFNVEDGTFTLKALEGFEAGAKTLTVTFGDTEETVSLKLTVKTQAVSLKLSSKTVTLNTAVDDSVQVKITAVPADYILDDLTIQGNEEGRLAVTYADGILTLGTNAKTEADKTYKLTLSAGGSQEVTLTVKTIDKAPTVTLKAKGSIDLTFPDQDILVTPAFKNYTGGVISGYTARITAADGTESEFFRVEKTEEGFQIRCTDAAKLTTGSYTLTLSLTLPGVEEPVEGTVKLTVKRTAVKLKLTPAKLTLNKTVSDKATVTVSCTTKGYAFDENQLVLKLMEKNGKDSAEGKLDVAFSDGKLNVAVNENTEYGATYKLLVQADASAPAATLTVSIPKESSSAIKNSLKAKGSIDVIREGTSVVLTPSYKNCAAAGDETLNIYSSADKYTANVNHLFHIEKDSQGRYVVTAAEGLDHSKTYKAQLVSTFGETKVVSGLTKITVKMGSAKLTLAAEDKILFARDVNSRLNFSLMPKDASLNDISEVTIKADKKGYDKLLEVIDYGNGEFALGFAQGQVDSSLVGKTITVTLNIRLSGNETAKVNATAKLKLTILK